VFTRARIADIEDDRLTAWLEGIGHEDALLLVTPRFMAPDFVYRHHPVTWSFIPANRETLDLLAARYVIGTFVLPTQTAATSLTPQDLTDVGLVLKQTAEYDGVAYWIFKRPSR
jgi:hypothetical protein